jgi:predicted RNA-binding Zn-ribbon protein involved in translation (DUF1610 family)
MQDFFGSGCIQDEDSKTEQGDGDDAERCDRCGAELEWTLDLDGVQRLECPNCGS